MNTYKNNVVVVTGGNGGMGPAAAKEFSCGGAKVVINGRDEKTLADAAAAIGGELLAVRANMNRLGDLDDHFARTKKKFGSIDVLFANPGMTLNRADRVRPMLAAALIACVGFSFASQPTPSAPAQAKTAAPGYYRLMLGDFEITVLSDGTASREVDKLSNKPQEVRDALDRDRRTSPIELSINAFLIHTGSKLLLVDTGAGELFGKSCGRLLENLRAAGYKPDQIDAVLLTHIHADHSGGLSVQGERMFSNALVYVDKRDPAFWLSESEEKSAPPAKKETFRQSHATIDPYVKADKLRPFDDAGELFPGIRAEPAYGHTPGHTAYTVESKGKRLLLWGDTIHIAEAQFPDPTITIEYDVDPKAAVASRLKLLGAADKEAYLVGGAHISFPGIGRVRAAGKGYRWIPLPYCSGP